MGAEGADAVASELTMRWSRAVTSAEAVERALYALADEVSGTVAQSDADWEATIYLRSGQADVDNLAHRLRQEVVDQSLRLKIAERTDPIRNLVFAVAFSRTGLSARSAESVEVEAGEQ